MHYQTLHDNNLDQHIKNSPVPIVVVFTAKWLGSAQILDNFFTELSVEYYPRIRFYRVDVEESQQIAADYGINKLPTTLILLSQNNLADHFIGILPKNEIREKLENVL